MSDSRQQVWDEFARAIELFDRKNADYGDAWRANGWRGNLSRVFEKAQRVRNLLWRSDPRTPAVGDEAALETLRDMLNSIVFAIINLQEEVEYGHEVPRSQRLAALGQDYTPGVAQDFYDHVGTQLAYNPVHEPGTQRIMVDRNLLVREEPLPVGPDEKWLDRQSQVVHDPLPVGPDEQGASEKKHDRAPRTGRPVMDSPQA